MIRKRPGEDGTHIDVLERVLDKGVLLSIWGRLSVVGLELVGVDMRVVVASIETHLRYADRLPVGSQSALS